jgi:GT2 family glycosyltransferase
MIKPHDREGLPAVSVVVVTWDNLNSLKQCLEHLGKAAAGSGLVTETIVVDNGSQDGTRQFLKAHEGIRYFSFDHNTGFGPASNRGIQMARAPLVVLLNDDIVVDLDFLKPMVRHFSKPEVFAVAPFMVLNGEPLLGRSVGSFKNGLMEIEIVSDHPGSPAKVLFAGGGAGMFRREMLMKLGCFDRLYHPFYFEDVDLGYRAWKRGWVCVSEPSSIVQHHHAGTIGKRFSQRHVYAIARRNYLLFHWKNIHDKDWIADHIRRLAKEFVSAIVSLKMTEMWALAMAFGKIIQAIKSRIQEKKQVSIGDKEVLNTVNQGDYTL